MQTLTIRPPARQLGFFVLSALVLGVVAVLATRNHLAGGDPGGRGLGFGIGAEVCLLIVALCAVPYACSFTECTPAGIRSRGLSGEWRCGWHEVSEIAIRPGMRGPTRTVALITRDGRVLALGTPVAGGVMPDRQFESKVRQIRDYWHRVRTKGGEPGHGAIPELPPAYPYGRTRQPAGSVIRGLEAVILLVALASVPVALAENGVALSAQFGRPGHGSFEEYDLTCATNCYWVGVFTPSNGSPPRDGMALAAGGPGLSPDLDPIPAVYLGSGAMVYRDGSGTSWSPFAVVLAIVIGCGVAVEVVAAVVRRWHGRSRAGQLPDPAAAHPVRPQADGSGWASARVLLTSTAVVLIVAASGAVVVLWPPPSFTPSAATLACTDYQEWLAVQGSSGPVDIKLLARARREAPAGRLSQDLAATLSAAEGDWNAQITAPGDGSILSRDCG